MCDWKPLDFLSACLCVCVYLIGFTVGEEEISDNWYFCVCGIFAPQLQIWWINLWYICVWVLFFAVCLCETRNLFPLAEIKCKQIEKLFFLCLFLLIKLCFVFNFVWIIYYYYYSIINSEIKKRSLQKKKENVGKSDFRYASLFCFVLLDFCCRKSREPKMCVGSLNSANITNDNLHFSFYRFAIS